MRNAIAATVLATGLLMGQTALAQPDSLKDWNGLWNDMSLYLDKPEIQSAWETAAKKANKTVAETKAAYTQKRRNEIAMMDISGNKIRMVVAQGANDDELGLPQVTEYEYKGEMSSKVGDKTRTWQTFEAKDKNARYPRLVLLPHQQPKAGELNHFHFRYGKESFEELLKKEKWFPTMIDPISSNQELIDEISE